MGFIKLIPGGERYLLVQELAKSAFVGSELSKCFIERYMFRYAKVKGNVLMFVFGHPYIKTAFVFKKDKFLANLREFWKANSERLKEHNITFAQIHCTYIAEKKSENEPQPAKKERKWQEKSFGKFENNAKNPEIYKAFETLRESILKKREEQAQWA